MTIPIITSITAGILLVFQQLLGVSVGMRRVSTTRGVGYGEDVNLERMIRRHGNLAENAAIFLVVLGLLEVIGVAGGVVMAFAGLFLVARASHAIGFSFLKGSHGGEFQEGGRAAVLMRSAGAMITVLTGMAAGSFLTYFAFSQLG